jgi:putative peptidoglycan lipid II flippase
VLNAHQHFLLAAVSPLITTAVVIILLAGLANSHGIYALGLGALIGTLIELAVVGTLTLRVASPRLSKRLWTPDIRELTVRFGATLIGAALMAATVLVDQAMSSTLAPGSVAALNYAIRLVTVPLALTAAALGTVILPHFSLMVSQARWPEANRALKRYLIGAIIVTSPIAVMLAVFATPLTEILLERGAFTAQDALNVGPTLAASSIEIPFYTCVIILMRLALALRLNAALAVISAVNLALNIALNAWLSSFLGVAGIALSTSLVYMCSCAMLLLVTRRKLGVEQRTGGAVLA